MILKYFTFFSNHFLIFFSFQLGNLKEKTKETSELTNFTVEKETSVSVYSLVKGLVLSGDINNCVPVDQSIDLEGFVEKGSDVHLYWYINSENWINYKLSKSFAITKISFISLCSAVKKKSDFN